MATSSIRKNFVIEGRKQVEMFANALEESENNRPTRIPINARQITDPNELRELMRRRKKANEQQ